MSKRWQLLRFSLLVEKRVLLMKLLTVSTRLPVFDQGETTQNMVVISAMQEQAICCGYILRFRLWSGSTPKSQVVTCEVEFMWTTVHAVLRVAHIVPLLVYAALLTAHACSLILMIHARQSLRSTIFLHIPSVSCFAFQWETSHGGGAGKHGSLYQEQDCSRGCSRERHRRAKAQWTWVCCETVHRTAHVQHTQPLSRVWLKARVAAFLSRCSTTLRPLRLYSIFRTGQIIVLRNQDLFLAVLSNMARWQVRSPNALAEVTTVLLPSRTASTGSTYNSGEDMSTALAESEVDERSDLGLLASPLVTRQLQLQSPVRASTGKTIIKLLEEKELLRNRRIRKPDPSRMFVFKCRQYTWLDVHTHFSCERVTVHSCAPCMSQDVSRVNVVIERPLSSSPARSSSWPSASTTSMERSCGENLCASARWSGTSGRMANPTVGFESNFPNFYSYLNREHTTIDIPDSHDVQCHDDATVISTIDPEGLPRSGASCSSKQTAARRVPSMFGPSSPWKKIAGYVSGRSGLQETGAVLDKDSVEDRNNPPKSLNGKLTRPSEARENGSAKIGWSWGWSRGKKLGEKIFWHRFSRDQSRTWISTISGTSSK